MLGTNNMDKKQMDKLKIRSNNQIGSNKGSPIRNSIRSNEYKNKLISIKKGFEFEKTINLQKFNNIIEEIKK